MSLDETAKMADDAFRNKKLYELIVLTDILIESEITGYMGSGYFLRGAYFECYGYDSNDLTKALENYKLATQVNPSSEAYVAMATIMYRLGPEHCESALEFLKKASSIKHIPEVDLGFAYIYMRTNPPDYDLAKSFFLKAARYGRAQGLFGYSYAARKLDQNFRAMIIDMYRVISSPLIYLFIGKKLIKGFRITEL